MQKITPFLWFDNQAEEAVKFYTSIFQNSKIGDIARYGDAGPGPQGTVMTAAFQIEGQDFIALNGGPVFQFTEAVSFVVHCESQEEVDYYWERLSAGGQEVQCGWLKDKFGLSWQIVPSNMDAMFRGDATAASDRAMAAMMTMKKLDMAAIERAYRG